MRIEDYFRIKGTYELKNGLYNVDGSVILKKIVDRLLVKFGKVSGHFSCSRNSLTSLEGSPQFVGGNFYCYSNKLTTLEGCPKRVGGDFSCDNNKLKTLECSPKSIGGAFICDDNKLTSLEGAPISVGGGFYCDDNLHNTKEYRQHMIMKKLRQ